MQPLKTLHHCVFNLNYHLVLVTKYRRKCITPNMMQRMETILRETAKKWDCELLEFNGEEDHVHLLLSTTPIPSMSKFINNLKTVSSRLIRKEFEEQLRVFYWKPVFWSRSYCLVSCGGAPLEVLRCYIEDQGHEKN